MSGSGAAGMSAAWTEAVTTANADVAASVKRRWSRRFTWFKSAFSPIIFCPPVSGADVVSHATFSSSAAVETRAISRSETIFHAFLAVLRTTGRLPETVIYLFFLAGNPHLADRSHRFSGLRCAFSAASHVVVP